MTLLVTLLSDVFFSHRILPAKLEISITNIYDQIQPFASLTFQARSSFLLRNHKMITIYLTKRVAHPIFNFPSKRQLKSPGIPSPPVNRTRNSHAQPAGRPPVNLFQHHARIAFPRVHAHIHTLSTFPPRKFALISQLFGIELALACAKFHKRSTRGRASDKPRRRYYVREEWRGRKFPGVYIGDNRCNRITRGKCATIRL